MPPALVASEVEANPCVAGATRESLRFRPCGQCRDNWLRVALGVRRSSLAAKCTTAFSRAEPETAVKRQGAGPPSTRVDASRPAGQSAPHVRAFSLRAAARGGALPFASALELRKFVKYVKNIALGRRFRCTTMFGCNSFSRPREFEYHAGARQQVVALLDHGSHLRRRRSHLCAQIGSPIKRCDLQCHPRSSSRRQWPAHPNIEGAIGLTLHNKTAQRHYEACPRRPAIEHAGLVKRRTPRTQRVGAMEVAPHLITACLTEVQYAGACGQKCQLCHVALCKAGSHQDPCQERPRPTT